MISARRVGRARHEFRFGGRELVVIAVVFCLVVGVVFAAGVVVGRETARGKGSARVEGARESRLADPEGLRGGDTTAKTAATRAEEKVTFYRTLTAPTHDLPQVGKPTIEERLVPKEELADSPAAPAAQVAPEPPRVAPERRTPKPPEAAPAPRPARAPRAAAAPSIRPGPTQLAATQAAAEPEAWTVQVSAFRSRALAEELRARLAARGFDAYVFPSITEDGRPRYRVRIGTYPARSDAERAAAELRSERGLNPLVTPRTR
ncbi:MAG TPA: SPOR domain-containing protein [Methylomirabilota bacterium]|jgi:cell division septation protein DedD|nr:SPOR domain-containing protein [Methylomirabilota bacterium]